MGTLPAQTEEDVIPALKTSFQPSSHEWILPATLITEDLLLTAQSTILEGKETTPRIISREETTPLITALACFPRAIPLIMDIQTLTEDLLMTMDTRNLTGEVLLLRMFTLLPDIIRKGTSRLRFSEMGLDLMRELEDLHFLTSQSRIIITIRSLLDESLLL